MHALVNKLTLAKPLDAEVLRKLEDFLTQMRREHPDFLDGRVIRVSDTSVIMVAFYATREALDEISSKVAAPWFAEHVRPYLGGPADRQVGEVVVRASP
jgi:hypothetical protein